MVYRGEDVVVRDDLGVVLGNVNHVDVTTGVAEVSSAGGRLLTGPAPLSGNATLAFTIHEKSSGKELYRGRLRIVVT